MLLPRGSLLHCSCRSEAVNDEHAEPTRKWTGCKHVIQKRRALGFRSGGAARRILGGQPPSEKCITGSGIRLSRITGLRNPKRVTSRWARVYFIGRKSPTWGDAVL